MYGAVQRYRSPCTVTHAVRGRFISYPDRKTPSDQPRWTIILIRSTILDAYTVQTRETAAGLLHESTTTLDGVVTSVGVVVRKRGRTGDGDVLLLGVGGMRVAGLVWDERVWDWVTIGIWDCGGFVEGEVGGGLGVGVKGEILVRGRDVGDVESLSEGRSLVVVDGKGRCFGVVSVSSDVVVVMPGGGDGDLEVGDDGENGESGVVEDGREEGKKRIEGSYCVDLWEYGLKHVKKAVFLDGSFEPTMVVLAEPKRSWAGRAAKAKLTSRVAAIRLAPQSKGHEVSWSLDKLPYNAFALIPVPEHAGGGVLVLAPSLALHVRHGAVASGLSFNSFGDDVADQYESVTQSETLLSADCARCQFMDTLGDKEMGMNNSAIALLSLKGGELYFLTVSTEHGMAIVRAGSSVIALNIVPINSRLFVLVSRLADTLLVEYCKSTSTARLEPEEKETTAVTAKVKRTPEEIEEYTMLYGCPPPDVEEEEENSEEKGEEVENKNDQNAALDLQGKDEGTRGIYDDSDELGWVFASSMKQSTSWALKVKDTIISYGPGADATIGLKNGKGSHQEFVIAGGHAKNGCLAIVNKSISINTHVRFPLADCEGAWALRDEENGRNRELDRRRRNEKREEENAQNRSENKRIEIQRKEWVDAQLAEYRSQLELQMRKAEQKDAISNVNDKSDENDGVNGSEEPPLKRHRPDNNLASEAINGELKVNGNPETAIEDPKSNNEPVPVPLDLDKEVQSMKAIYEEQVDNHHPFLEEEQLEPDIADSKMDSLLVMSRAEDTVLLTVDRDLIEEVTTTTGFRRNVTTTAAGNVASGAAYVQVTKEGVVLLSGLQQVDEYSVASTLEIKSANIYDLWIALLLSDGSALFLEVKEDEELKTVIGNDEESRKVNPKALKMYLVYNSTDDNICAGVYCGPLAHKSRRVEASEIEDDSRDSKPGMEIAELQDSDEEGLLLYGEAGLRGAGGYGAMSDNANTIASGEKGTFTSCSRDKNRVDDTLFVLVKTDGVLELVNPNRSTVYRTAQLSASENVLIDEGQERGGNKLTNNSENGTGDGRVIDVLMKAVSGSLKSLDLSTTLLVASLSSGIAIYRAFVSTEAKLGCSRVRFIKVIDQHFSAWTMLSAKSSQLKLTGFDSISSNGGIFVGGRNPAFILCERGVPRVHMMHLDDEDVNDVRFFSPFDNVTCSEGFLMGSTEEVQISEISYSKGVSYGGEMSVKKIGLRCTVQKVCFHSGSGCYGVLASMPTLIPREERLARIIQSLEKHDKRHYENTIARIEAARQRKRVPELYEDLYELRLYRADGMELIRSHKLKEGEVGLSLANIQVTVFKRRKPEPGFVIATHNKAEDGSESAFAASRKLRPKDMLVVGTGFLNGEDASSKGRLLMFEVNRQESYTEQGGEYTAFQMQLIAEKTCPGPVTAVAALEGYVVCGVGPQVHVYKLVGDEIVHLSFAFAQLYIASIATLKQYVVTADMVKSIQFLFWRERNNSVNFLGKDYEHLEAYATEYLIDNDQLSIVLSDSRGNIQLMDYVHVSNPESRGGTRLLSNGGVCISTRINQFLRARVIAPSYDNTDSTVTKTKADTGAGTHATLFPAHDGSIGGVVPIDMKTFHLLLRLLEVLENCDALERYAGLNPKLFSAFRPQSQGHQMLDQRLVSCHLLRQFWNLDHVTAMEVAEEAGTNVEQIAQIVTHLHAVLDQF